MQQALIVRYRFREDRRQSALEELNDLLEDGWRVVHAFPMGGAPVGSTRRDSLYAVFASLVILEKDG